jgi:hypothetical protein
MGILMLKTRDGDEPMQSGSHALRPARIVNDDLRHFTGTTFPEDPLQGCSLMLRRLEAFGMIADADADQWVDVLADNGDILHEVPVTIKGFEYLRRTLKFVREK